MTKPFSLPDIPEQPSGWGPPAELPDHIANIPYAPFNKSDKLGKIADWSNPETDDHHHHHRGGHHHHHRGRLGGKYGAGHQNPSETVSSAFTFQSGAAGDDASFSLVDRSSVVGSSRKSFAATPVAGVWASRGNTRSSTSKRPAGSWGTSSRTATTASTSRTYGSASTANKYGARRFGRNAAPVTRDSSIKIKGTWDVVQEMDFSRMSKLYFEPPAGEDISTYGFLSYYERGYDRVTAKNERPLAAKERIVANVTTSQDPIIQDLAADIQGLTVFATDTILSALMCCTRSVYSWDIIVTKKGDKIYLDKRDKSSLDLWTVNENAVDTPSDHLDKEGHMNGPAALAQEATRINRTFVQQTLKPAETVTFSNANPFKETASIAYRYRSWNLGDDITLVARTHVDCAVHTPGSGTNSSVSDVTDSSAPLKDTSFANVYALNEFDSKSPGSGGAPDWRQKLDSQRGAVIATELKNNAFKLSRWTLECLLASADQLRIGFVSRFTPKDRSRHVLLGTASFAPSSFASQMNLNVGHSWGVLKTIIDILFNKLDDGQYVLIKDPSRASLKLYSIGQDLIPLSEPIEDDE